MMRSLIVASKYMLFLLCFALVACAPAREFAHVPQAGAHHQGQYPRFSDKPQAETAQFTREERASLIGQLDETRQEAVREATTFEHSARGAALSRQDAQREVEATLKAIEQGN